MKDHSQAFVESIVPSCIISQQVEDYFEEIVCARIDKYMVDFNVKDVTCLWEAIWHMNQSPLPKKTAHAAMPNNFTTP